MLSASELDGDAKHLIGLHTPENYTSSPLLSAEIMMWAVPGTRGTV